MMVYISGPITNNDNYILDFYNRESQLKKMGYQVCNPAAFSKEVEADILYRFGRKPTYNEYMKVAIKKLLDCDAITMLPNWEQSKGATAERQIAIVLNYIEVEVKECLN